MKKQGLCTGYSTENRSLHCNFMHQLAMSKSLEKNLNLIFLSCTVWETFLNVFSLWVCCFFKHCVCILYVSAVCEMPHFRNNFRCLSNSLSHNFTYLVLFERAASHLFIYIASLALENSHENEKSNAAYFLA